MDRRHFIGTAITGAAAVGMMTIAPSAMAGESSNGKKSKIAPFKQTFQAPLGGIRGLYTSLSKLGIPPVFEGIYPNSPSDVQGTGVQI